MYTIEGENVYFEDEGFRQQYGVVNKTETNRIDANTVEDVAYTFDLELGDYVENTAIPRVTRNEPLPPIPETDQQKIARLEIDNASLRNRDAEIQDTQNFIIETLIDKGIIV